MNSQTPHTRLKNPTVYDTISYMIKFAKEYAKNLGDVAWTSTTSGGELQDVASAKMSNIWGLYDMLGNVTEWTSDWLDEEYYRNSPAKDPKGPATGSLRVTRGGNVGIGDMVARYSYRFADKPGERASYLGFRIVRERK